MAVARARTLLKAGAKRPGEGSKLITKKASRGKLKQPGRTWV